MTDDYQEDEKFSNDIAIIGMAGRFPMAESVDEFWTNLVSSRDCITRFSADELRKYGVSEAALADPHFVPAAGFVPDQDKFDAHFFEMNPREAAQLDPQHRIALEVAWQALEHAGYTPESVNGSVGVFGGVNISTYFIFNLLQSNAADVTADALGTLISIDKDMFASRISYKLNLNGPSVALGTACSTSLVCIHLACQSLLNGESKMTIAGGSHIATPNTLGHVYHEGGYSSPDDFCRAFDAKGRGTIAGNGTCFLVLKRLDDALADNDTVYAVIKGSAVNNDGSEKIGYTAPSIVGQTNIIAEAQAVAGVEPESIRFIEAHGTATPLGDPIEFAALTKAFRLGTERRNFCGIGSVKSNIGHLGVAAGAASMVKAALALKHKVIPESLHFETANPKLEIENSPFYVVDRLERIEAGKYPARAGVSSLGIGGTNAHIILEEPPAAASSESRDWQLLLLSAKTPAALDRMTDNLSAYLAKTTDEQIADVAYTLQVGRHGFDFRRAMVVAADRPDRLAPGVAAGKGFAGRAPEKRRKIIFMFPGGGTQYVNMARGLYDAEPAFKENLDRCAALFKRKMGLDLIDLLYPGDDHVEQNSEILQKPKHFFAALFAVEYSLAQLWMSWDIKPDALVGHSLGEYTAACIAGVFSLDTAVDLICCRGALFEKIEKGSMISVTLPAADVEKLLIEGVSIAAVNDPGRCVVAGRFEPMQVFERMLEEQQIEYKKLLIDTAGHSPMVDGILDEFGQFLHTIKFGTAAIPFISNMSGDWADANEIAKPDYWKNHLRRTVRFSDGVATLLKDGGGIFLEMGPGNALCSFVRSQLEPDSGAVLLNTLRHVKEDKHDQCHLLEVMGKLWLAGAAIDWKAFYANETRKRIGLPAYPFDRKRYWVEARQGTVQSGAKLPVAEWLWQPSWRLDDQASLVQAPGAPGRVLLFVDSRNQAAGVAAALNATGAQVVSVMHGEAFTEIDSANFRIDSHAAADYQRLVARLLELQALPATLVHCWSLSSSADAARRRVDSQLSLVYLAQALGAANVTEPMRIVALTRRREAVLAGDDIDPSQSLITGPANVIPFEYPHIRFTTVDIDPAQADEPDIARLVTDELALLAAQDAASADRPAARRNGLRFVKDFVPLLTPEHAAEVTPIRRQGVYLITGGLGGVGMVHAQALIGFKPKLALLQRSAFPDEDKWKALLAAPDTDALLKAQIREVQGLRVEGAEVLLVQADVTDADQCARAIAQVREVFGPIHGLIHCAGYGEFVPIQETSRQVIDAVLAPKLDGTDNLLAALTDAPPELVLLCSSMSAQTTGFGLVGYVSACAYLDAIAQRNRHTRGTRYVTINWDVWNTPQQLIKAQSDSALLQRLQENKNAILPREGINVIYRALASGRPQTVVSTVDFRQLLRKNSKLAQALADNADGAEAAGAAAGSSLYERPSLSSEYVAPETEEEALLVQIWQETLGIDKIGINDNFFELGGESLLGVKIVVKAKKMGLHIEPKKMFATPTIAQIAATLSRTAASTAPASGEQPSRYALTPLQSEIYRRYSEPGRRPSNVTQALTVMEGPLDKGLVQAVWQAVVSRHKALRTRFTPDENGALLQVVEDAASFALLEVDYATLDEAAQQQAMNDLMTKDRQERYDLEHAPAMRVYWINLSPQKTRFALLLSQHQIILDGWTSSLMSADMMACMESIATGRELPPPISSVEFSAYVAWLAGQAADACRAWWRGVFAGYVPVEPLLGMMSQVPLTADGADVYADYEFGIDDAMLATIQNCAKATRTTANAVFQAAWALSLAQISGAGDVVYGVTISGRSGGLDGVEEVVGQCTNSLPVRIPVAGSAKVADLLQAVHAANADAQSHNGLSASEVAALAGCAPDQALYASNFIFENVPRAEGGDAGAPIRTLSSKWVDGWHFPLRVFVVPEQKTWMRFAFDKSRFAPDDIQSLAENYRQNLAAIAEQPDAAVSQMLLGDCV